MSNISKQKVMTQAKDSFSRSEYKNALDKFGEVLQNYPNSKEAFNGVVLSEMAMSGEGGAEALFEYYEILKTENSEEADKIIGDIIDSMDGTLEQLSAIFEPLVEKLEYEDGILYDDFMDIVKQEDDFKEPFENIMFSTKVIITKKSDFLLFLDDLIEHNFTEMALSYLESAISNFGGDEKLNALIEKITDSKGVKIEN